MNSHFVKMFPAARDGSCLGKDCQPGDHTAVSHRREHRRFERYWIKSAEPTWHWNDPPRGRGRFEQDAKTNRSSNRMCRAAARKRNRRWVGGKR